MVARIQLHTRGMLRSKTNGKLDIQLRAGASYRPRQDSVGSETQVSHGVRPCDP